MRLMVMTRQTFICAPMSMTIEARIANAKLAANFSVNTAVCVRNPGPMADVAMMNAAPSSTDHLLVALRLPITASAMMPPCRCVMPEESRLNFDVF